MEVAKTIARQIGNKALYMLGAKNMVGGDNFFAFKVRGSRKANYIRITLTSMDTYVMEFKKLHGMTVKDVATHTNVYADMMHKLIEKETGLYTKLF